MKPSYAACSEDRQPHVARIQTAPGDITTASRVEITTTPEPQLRPRLFDGADCPAAPRSDSRRTYIHGNATVI